MTTVREAETRMRGFLSPRYVDDSERPVEWRAIEWIGFSQNYLRAAVVVQADNVFRSPASLYLSGHGLECALKACIRADGDLSPHSHDLIRLMEHAEAKGYRLHEQQLWCLIKLNWNTFADPETGTAWKARYPPLQAESDPMRPPDAVDVLRAGVELLKQVARRVALEVDWDAWRIEIMQLHVLRGPHSGAPEEAGGASETQG